MLRHSYLLDLETMKPRVFASQNSPHEHKHTRKEQTHLSLKDAVPRALSPRLVKEVKRNLHCATITALAK